MAFKAFQLDAGQVERNLLAKARTAPRTMEGALLAVALEWEGEMKERTPVDTGTLRGTYEVETRIEATGIEAEIRCGGPAASYAPYVHENTGASHPVGQAKFMESVVLERKGTLIRDVKKHAGTL